MLAIIISKYNYWVYIILMMIGLYAMLAKRNLVKKLIGMNIFQTAIILFYISIGVKTGGANVPILTSDHGHKQAAINVAHYLNPLPHVLMLTAIVLSIATTGVALAVLILIYRKYQTLQEDEILEINKEAGA